MWGFSDPTSRPGSRSKHAKRKADSGGSSETEVVATDAVWTTWYGLWPVQFC